MKNTTRLLSLVLVVCMLLGMIPAVSATTAAAQTVTPEVVEPDYFTTSDWIWSSTSVTKNSVSYFRNDYELKAVPTALDVPTPYCAVSAYNESTVSYILQVWSTSDNYWTTLHGINRNIRSVFKEKGVIMTYPHLNVHLDK